MAKKPKPRVQTLTLEQAAALLIRSRTWVTDRIREGYIKRDENGLSVLAIVRGAMAYYEDLLVKTSKSAAAARVTDARTREIEIRIAERMAELIPLEDAQAVVMELAATVRGELTGFPIAFTRDVAERRKLQTAVDGILRRMADKAKAASAALAIGVDDLGAITQA